MQADVQAEAVRGDRGRFVAGLPRVSDGSLLFLMHLLSKRHTDGRTTRIGIVLNGSPLFTGNAGSGESEIRRWLMEDDFVEAIVALGVADRPRIAIGGHSYGAFMTANLLAHAPALFCCGIARSGAYNRTLTPFGFQAETRTLWQAPGVYAAMSPYLYAHRIEAPLLLIHGEADANPGTAVLQSERMYGALKGHGKAARLVLLPHEGHGYRARESVLHVLAEMDAWLERYCKRGEG